MYLCIYIYGRSVINMWLVSEYTFLKTATFEMEAFVAIVNGFHVLNVARQGFRFCSC